MAGDEGIHRPGPDPLWAESWAFEFFDGQATLGGHLRLGVHPAASSGRTPARQAWYWTAVAGPQRRTVAVRDHEVPVPRAGTLEVRAEALWSMLTCETPGEHWSVGLEAFGVAYDDPVEAYGTERGDRVALGLDLEWEATAPMFAYPGGVGYQQACRVHGEVLVGEERVDFDGWGQRDHWWGPQDWWGQAGWSAAGRLDDGAAVFAARVADDGGRTCRTGYLASPGGGLLAVTSVAVDGAPAPDELPGRTGARVGDLGLSVTPRAHAPVLVPALGGGGPAHLARALVRFETDDGRSGAGWASWLSPAG